MLCVGKLQIGDMASPLLLEAKGNPMLKVQYKYALMLKST